jgi:hypothetical protein
VPGVETVLPLTAAEQFSYNGFTVQKITCSPEYPHLTFSGPSNGLLRHQRSHNPPAADASTIPDPALRAKVQATLSGYGKPAATQTRLTPSHSRTFRPQPKGSSRRASGR